MKAIVMRAPYDVSVEEVQTPEVQEGQALVKILQAGICGGDIHFYDGSNPYSSYPQIYGHEMVGEIVEIQDPDSDLKPGDLVVAEILLPCGTCYTCRRGKPNCCPSLKVVGVQVPGVYAEYTLYPVKNLHRVPKNLTPDDAVLCEPYSIGHHIVGRSGIPEGELALVIGTGTIGLTIIDMLKNRNVTVIASDTSDYKLDKAKQVGADYCVNPLKEDVLAFVKEMTQGQGVGYVFEATGSTKVMSSTQDYVAAGGTIVLAGITSGTVEINSLFVTKKELSILGSRNAHGDFEPVLELMSAGKLHQKELLTNKFSMYDAAEAFHFAHDTRNPQIKVVIEMK